MVNRAIYYASNGVILWNFRVDFNEFFLFGF